jgi:erythromycin esterase
MPGLVQRLSRDAAFVAEQNACVAAGAEAYYRAMVHGGPGSWNVRDTHMADTLDSLLAHYAARGSGPAPAIVWEHNTHVGDARYTECGTPGWSTSVSSPASGTARTTSSS